MKTESHPILLFVSWEPRARDSGGYWWHWQTHSDGGYFIWCGPFVTHALANTLRWRVFHLGEVVLSSPTGRKLPFLKFTAASTNLKSSATSDPCTCWFFQLIFSCEITATELLSASVVFPKLPETTSSEDTLNTKQTTHERHHPAIRLAHYHPIPSESTR